MKQTIVSLSKNLVFTIGFFFVGAAVLQAAGTWTAPTQTPPNGNVDAPLNRGADGQDKIGGLILNTGGSTNGLLVQSGKVGVSNLTPTGDIHIGSSADANIKRTLWMETANSKVRMVSSSYNGENSFWIQTGTTTTTGSSGNVYFTGMNGTPFLFTIRDNGKVGIRTQTPTADLEVNGFIKITGGNPGEGKVLMSDANGLATWVPMPRDDTYTYVDRILFSYDDDDRFGVNYSASDTCDQNTNARYICPNGTSRTCRDYVYSDQASNDYYVRRYDVTCYP